MCVTTTGLGAGPAMSPALDDRARAVEKQAAATPSPQFRAAAQVPGDVTLYLHIEDAAAIRREVAGRPIAVWFNETLAAGEAGRVWSQVAKAADLDEAALFDALLGRRVTFVVRGPAAEVGGQIAKDDNAPAAEWALLTEVTVDAAEKALAALEPIALGPRSRMAMLELPEHELLLARRGDLLLIGPKENRRLFRQMLRAIGGREVDDVEMLAAKMTPQALKRAGDPASGPSVALFLQHEAPLGGYSLAVAEFAPAVHATDGAPAPHLIVRHYGSFDAPPFTRGVTRGVVDCSILDAFDGEPLLAMVEPNDAGRSRLELFLHAVVGEGLLTPKMRANLGERRIMVIGQQSREQGIENGGGKTQPPAPSPVSLVPSVAVCYELKKTDDAAEQLDRQMLAFSRRLNRLGGGQADAPSGATDFACGRPRSVEVPAAAKVFDDVSLNWTLVADGPHGEGGAGWYVIASHPDQLDEIVSILSRSQQGTGNREEGRGKADPPVPCPPPSPVATQALHSAGVAHGPRLAHLLQSLRTVAALFAEDEDQREEMHESIRLLSDLAAGLEHVRWRLTRPSANEIDVEVHIRLAE